jgi:endonuclease YncB( thermonuclease family)
MTLDPRGLLYVYRMIPVRVVDGDTVIMDWDLGDRVMLLARRFRLIGIQAPEIGTEGGAEAKAALESLVGFPSPVPCYGQTVKDRKDRYGRYLVDLWVPDKDGPTWKSASDEMRKQGHAKPYEP